MSDFNFLKVKDYTLSGKEFELRYDEEKDLLFTYPKINPEKLSEFYKSEDYISHTDSAKSPLEKIYQAVKKIMIRQKISWIKKYKTPEKILDLGAGTGDFLKGAKENGWEINGVEPNAAARELAEKKGIVLEQDSGIFPSATFDVISMWHVLEHVPNLEEQIEELDRLLKEDGILVIAVPNFKSYDAKKYKEFWAAFDVPRHVWHFSETAIKNIFSKYNFEVIKTKGLFFDAFYVSLLSEKYKNKSPNFFCGIFSGVLSNLKAIKTSEYSSKVYFLRKRAK